MMGEAGVQGMEREEAGGGVWDGFFFSGYHTLSQHRI